MGNTKEGAKKTRDKLLAKDPDYYKKLGKLGGEASEGYSFGHGKVDPSEAGRVGGKRSKRGKK